MGQAGVLADEFAAELDALKFGDFGQADEVAYDLFRKICRERTKAEVMWHVAATLRWAYGKAANAAKHTRLGLKPSDLIPEDLYLRFATSFAAANIVAGSQAKVVRLARRR
jgi:hypothetical protein